MSRILVTGAGGFIGSFLSRHLAGHEVVKASLRAGGLEGIGFEGLHAVIHLAGIAHAARSVPEEEYYAVNTELALETARRAKEGGVRKFLYMSSSKVYGEKSAPGVPFTEQSMPNPVGAYAASKLKAEEHLMRLSDPTFRVCIVRPPLVYGPSVKGNYAAMRRMVEKRIPLPFRGVQNRRSVVYVGNLQAFLEALIVSEVGEGIFNVADPAPISTEELCRLIARSLSIEARFFRIPAGVIRIAEMAFPGTMIKLFSDFELSCADSYARSGFTPPFTTEDGTRRSFEEETVG